jgi:hypothetical protein
MLILFFWPILPFLFFGVLITGTSPDLAIVILINFLLYPVYLLWVAAGAWLSHINLKRTGGSGFVISRNTNIFALVLYVFLYLGTWTGAIPFHI